jgi:hypothetical protein
MQQALFLMLGLNPEAWHGSSAEDHHRLKIAGILFSVFLLLSCLGGLQFIHAITGSWLAGLTGGLLLGLAMANIIRLAMITIVIRFNTSLKPEPEEEPENAPAVLAEPSANASPENLKNKINPATAIKSASQYLTITEFIRAIFILMVAIAVAFPFTAILLFEKTDGLLNARRELVISEYMSRHPDYPTARINSFKEKINEEYFPIHIYIEFSKDPIAQMCIGLVIILAFTPYFMLRNQQRTRSRKGMNGYFSLNRELMKQLIIKDHNEEIEKAKGIMLDQFPEAGNLDIDPHAEFANPPFNTELKEPNQKDWISEEQWNKYLKGV